MKSGMLVAIAALAAFAGTAVRADEADASQFSSRFTSTRTRAEVRAEAEKVTANHNTEPAGSRVAPPLKSGVEAKAVRLEAAEAVRLGRIPRGEADPS